MVPRRSLDSVIAKLHKTSSPPAKANRKPTAVVDKSAKKSTVTSQKMNETSTAVVATLTKASTAVVQNAKRKLESITNGVKSKEPAKPDNQGASETKRARQSVEQGASETKRARQSVEQLQTAFTGLRRFTKSSDDSDNVMDTESTSENMLFSSPASQKTSSKAKVAKRTTKHNAKTNTKSKCAAAPNGTTSKSSTKDNELDIKGNNIARKKQDNKENSKIVEKPITADQEGKLTSSDKPQPSIPTPNGSDSNSQVKSKNTKSRFSINTAPMQCAVSPITGTVSEAKPSPVAAALKQTGAAQRQSPRARQLTEKASEMYKARKLAQYHATLGKQPSTPTRIKDEVKDEAKAENMAAAIDDSAHDSIASSTTDTEDTEPAEQDTSVEEDKLTEIKVGIRTLSA